MTLGLNPVTGAVQWTITGEGDGRALVFTAKERRLRPRAGQLAGCRACARRPLSSARMTGGPEVHADRVVFRLEDRGFSVRPAPAGARAPAQRPGVRPRRRRPLGARVPPPPGRPHGVPLRGRRRVVLRPAQPAARARSVRRQVRRRVPRLRARRPGSRRPSPSPPADRRARRAVVAAGHRPAPAAPAARRPRRRRVRAPRRAHAARRATRSRPRRLPPCRVALLDPVERNETYSASTRYARTLAARSRSSPRRPRTPASAPASARSRCCTRAGCTRARSAR